jgi:hypothetical protein
MQRFCLLSTLITTVVFSGCGGAGTAQQRVLIRGNVMVLSFNTFTISANERLWLEQYVGEFFRRQGILLAKYDMVTKPANTPFRGRDDLGIPHLTVSVNFMSEEFEAVGIPATQNFQLSMTMSRLTAKSSESANEPATEIWQASKIVKFRPMEQVNRQAFPNVSFARLAWLANEVVVACLERTTFEILIPMPQRSPMFQQ